MSRQLFLDLARSGLAMPIGTDLLLHEQPDAEAVLLDGDRLGKLTAAAAARYGTMLAVPLMDLRIEKQAIGRALGMAEMDIETMMISQPLSVERIAAADRYLIESPTPRMWATEQAIRYVAEHTELLPIGMCIGPFSLTVKLLADPIMPVYSLAAGAMAEDDPEVALLLSVMDLSRRVVLTYVRRQIAAGARAMFICEPAANVVFLSPRQMADHPADRPDALDRCVMQPLHMLAELLREAQVDMLLHDCGELCDQIVRRLGHDIHPAVLSLGSPRKLWEDARLVPDDVVLYGNLPSKRFYSDQDLPVAQVQAMIDELRSKMAVTGQPYILGTECDVLHVPQFAQTIRDKVSLLTKAQKRPAPSGCGCGGH
ncbi:MAG: hypothetical protein IT445_13755 [Phycisphaeraceae bacterium]|nr:hypothetical protein [Phycisphaeraceae bacterium]